MSIAAQHISYNKKDVDMIGSFYRLIELSKKKPFHSRFQKLDFLDKHRTAIETLLRSYGAQPSQYLQSGPGRPFILNSYSDAFIMFFCFELITRHRQTLGVFLEYQMSHYYAGPGAFIQFLKNEVHTHLIDNDPFQDETLIHDIDYWIVYRVIPLHPQVSVATPAVINQQKEIEKTIKRRRKTRKRIVQRKLIEIESGFIERLHSFLEPYFDKSKSGNLLKALKGYKLKSKLVFLGNANQFTDIFWFLKQPDHDKIRSKKPTIQKWIFEQFQYAKGNGPPHDFNLDDLQQSLFRQNRRCKSPLPGLDDLIK